MSEVTFKDYIDTLVSNKNYEELFVILSYCDYQKLDEHLLKIMATASYRLKKYNTCIELCNHWIELGYPEDYFIFEIFAESLYQQNQLDEALVAYRNAIKLRPSLKFAGYRLLTLEYRLESKLNKKLMNKVLQDSLSTNRFNYIRSISYIQLSEGMYQDAYANLKLVLDNTINKIYFLDLLSICYIIEKKLLNKKISFTNDLKKDLALYQSQIEKKTFEYKFESIDSNTLFITLSPTNSFLFQKYNYEADKLFLVDATASYFIFSYEAMSDFVVNLVKKYGYKRVSIAGSSKGATGAILLLNRLTTLLPTLDIKTVAFSPQVKLWPFNTNLIIPSYKALYEYVGCNVMLQEFFKNSIKNLEFDIKENCRLTIFYGEHFKTDKMEISHIKNGSPQVSIIGLEYSGHGTSIPLTIPENKSKEELRKRYAGLAVDPDFAELGGDKLVDIVDEIFEIYSDPNMRLYKFLW